MNMGYYDLATAIVMTAVKDYKIGFRALYAKYGTSFLKPDFAFRLSDESDDAIFPYAVTATKKRLNKNQNRYFSALDYFRSDEFSVVSDADPEYLIRKLENVMLNEMHKKAEKLAIAQKKSHDTKNRTTDRRENAAPSLQDGAF